MALTGIGLANFAHTKLGTPYFYGSKIGYGVLTESFMARMNKSYPNVVTPRYMAKARQKKMVGKVCVDCSGLIGAYRGRELGSSQLYQTASKRLNMGQINNFPVGTVLWKSGHVGVYIGNGYCIEAKGIDYGVVKTKVSSTKWKYGLLFSDISYSSTVQPKDEKTNSKNPYSEPSALLRKGSVGEGVKWLQYELIEAGYGNAFKYNKLPYGAVKVDGKFGPITNAALKSFQSSCKIECDGVCGSVTRKYLKEK